MGAAESRTISDVGAFAINLIENPTKTISGVASNPGSVVTETKASVLNENPQSTVVNTTNFQAPTTEEATRSGFAELIAAYDSPEAQMARGEYVAV